MQTVVASSRRLLRPGRSTESGSDSTLRSCGRCSTGTSTPCAPPSSATEGRSRSSSGTACLAPSACRSRGRHAPRRAGRARDAEAPLPSSTEIDDPRFGSGSDRDQLRRVLRRRGRSHTGADRWGTCSTPPPASRRSPSPATCSSPDPRQPMLRGRVDLAPLGRDRAEGQSRTGPCSQGRGGSTLALPVRAPLVARGRHLTVFSQALEDAIEDRASSCHRCGSARRWQVPPSGYVRGRASARSTTSSSGRPPPTASASRSRHSSSCSRRRPGDRVERRVGRGGAPDCSPAPDRPLGTTSHRSLGSASRSRSTLPRRCAPCSRFSPPAPLVVVLDDVHSAEPPMLDLTDAVIDRVHASRLFCAWPRPELLEQRPHRRQASHVDRRDASPRFHEDARRLAATLLGSSPAAVARPACANSGGPPAAARRPRGDPRRIRSTSAVPGWVPTTPTSRPAADASHAALPTASIDLGPGAGLVDDGVRRRPPVPDRPLHALAPVCVGTPRSQIDRSSDKVSSGPEDLGRGSSRFAHALVLIAAYEASRRSCGRRLHRPACRFDRQGGHRPDQHRQAFVRPTPSSAGACTCARLGHAMERLAGLLEHAGGLFADAE